MAALFVATASPPRLPLGLVGDARPPSPASAPQPLSAAPPAPAAVAVRVKPRDGEAERAR